MTDFVTQGDMRAAHMPNLHPGLLAQLTSMLHECNSYVQSFSALRDWATPVNAPNLYRMIIHSDKRPASEHFCRYNGLSTSEIAAIILGAEDGIVGRQDLVIRRRGELNANGSERFDIIPVTHRS